MKKKTQKIRLTLNRETLRPLGAPELLAAQGGEIPPITGLETQSCRPSCIVC